MDALNNYISDASLIKSLCKHNKMHIQEIDRLQTLNAELEELIGELKNRLERLEEIETLIEKLEEENKYTDKELLAGIRKQDYVKTIHNEFLKTQRNLSKLRKEHARLMVRFINLEKWRVEMEKDKKENADKDLIEPLTI